MKLRTVLASVLASVAMTVTAQSADQAEPATDAGLASDPGFSEAISAAKEQMMGDPALAAKHAREAEAIAEANETLDGAETGLATALWLQAEAGLRLNDPDGTGALITRALALASSDGVFNKLDGDLQLTRARHAARQGRIDAALEGFHEAHDRFAALGEARSQSMALQGLGSIYAEAHDHDKVLDYYARATSIYSGDPALDLPAANNIANAYAERGDFDMALVQFQLALKAAEDLKSGLLQARIVTNIALVQNQLGQYWDADATADRALRLLNGSENDKWDLFVWGVKGQAALGRGEIGAAIAAIEKTFDGADLTTTTPPFRDMHEIAFEIYSAAGELDRALAHHIAFKRLDDGGRELTASTNLALITGQFDLASKQLEIAQLTRGQLERDLALEEARVQKQRLIFLALFVLSFGASTWIAVGYVSMRRHRNAMNKANTKLRGLVDELNDEISLRKETEDKLRSAKEEAEQASHSKTQFLANMSHELRTPLNAIIGFAEIIEGEIMGPVGTPTYQGYAGDIRESGQHLLAIVSDILDMAKIDAGRMVLNEEEFELETELSRLVSSLTTLAHSQETKLEFRDTGTKTVVLADQRFLQQILTNLVSNAIKFTGEGGQVSLFMEPADDGGIVLSVHDNGIGIGADKMDRILEPFAQVEDSFARSSGGVGLGLPIVRSLVELHGGRFWLESELSKGTNAHVYLPAQRIMQTSRTLKPSAAI